MSRAANGRPDQRVGGSPLPRVRRLPYYARELMGNYSPDDRFVYVSDGGHYDNLGLLELLRRRCRRVYCVDGVALSPAHHGDPAHPQLRNLKGRLSARSVVTGQIHYPAVAGVAEVGTLVVGKAVLTAELPFSVLAHAVSDPRFPGDSAADQWFDAEQFDAYQALGRRIGAAMLAADPDSMNSAARNGSAVASAAGRH